MKTAKERVKVVLSEGETKPGFVKLDGEFLESMYNDVIRHKVADQIIKAINDTVKMCCDEFAKNCPHGCINCYEAVKRSGDIQRLLCEE